eukprot:TRINITY_DN14081_c0_g1_i3.p1 TRINITY_DN14081_c0_g1~~TRINITY_DN14081_c0_g1_i3.p1  ORF type:complete len:139 (+),score=18.08 TRINITY_DN14081_c0_g1_i3:394-810(+)
MLLTEVTDLRENQRKLEAAIASLALASAKLRTDFEASSRSCVEEKGAYAKEPVSCCARALVAPIEYNGWSKENLERQALGGNGSLAKAYLGLFHCIEGNLLRDVPTGRHLLSAAATESGHPVLQTLARFWVRGDIQAQ